MKLKLLVLFLLLVASYHFTTHKEYYFYRHSVVGLEKPAINWVEERIKLEINPEDKSINQKSIQLLKEKVLTDTIDNLAWIKITPDGIESELTESTRNSSGEKRYNIILQHLKALQKQGYVLPECEFFLGVQDAWTFPSYFSDDEIENLPPIFVFAANKSFKFRHKLILFPDDHTLGADLIGYRRGWSKIIYETLHGSKKPYEEKIPKAFWRGLNNYTHLYNGKSAREILVDAVKESNNFDVEFNNDKSTFLGGFFVKNLRPVLQIFGVRPYYNIPQQLNYQVLINIDGATSTYPGFLYRLLSNSVTLKVESGNEQWFYNLVKPNEHYVPVRELAEITSITESILSNPQKSKEIASNSTTLIEENLMPEHINYYIVELLKSYASTNY